MFRKNLTSKLLAMALVFTLTFADFAFVTKTYASSLFEIVFSSKGTTGSKDIEFDAYFSNGEETSESLRADVNSEELKLYFDLKMDGKGYIKDGVVSILESNEGDGLNFKLGKVEELEDVETVEDNNFYLAKIKGETEKIIEVPIEYQDEEFIDLDKLSKDFKVKFTGTYVNEKAEEVQLEKEIPLNVSWYQEREFKVESNLTKFFEYQVDGENYATVQTQVRIDTNTDKKSLPVDVIETTIKLPEIEGTEITNIAIVPQSTSATNNKSNENVEFNASNVYANSEEGTLTIKTKNEIQTVTEVSDEILKKEEEIVSEKYFSGKGVDEYLITYTIKNLNIESEAQLEQKVTTQITDYSGTEKVEEADALYTLSETTGDNLSYQLINETDSMSKGYAYLNYNLENKNEIEYKTKSVINISNHEFVEEIDLTGNEMYYVSKNGERLEANDTYYKNISISKENFDKLCGEDGKIEIFDSEANLLATLDSSAEAQEEYLVASLEEKPSRVFVKVSAPIAEGNLNLNITRAQTNLNYDKQTYQNIDSLNENIIVKAKYKDASEFADVANEVATTKLEDTISNVNLVLDRDSLSTLALNEDVEFKIELNNQKIESDVFGNSVYEIELPEEIRSLEITNYSLVYGEGLEISNVEAIEHDGKIFIRVNVSGKQNELSSGIVTNGTNIVITANVGVYEYTPAIKDEIKLYYYNEESTNYIEETASNLLGQTCGLVSKEIQYSAPSGVVSINSTSNYNENGNEIKSINQGIKKDKLEIYSSEKNAKMELVVMNNNQSPVSNIAILGRIPFQGVQDIVSGKDLGTTVDSRLLSGITSNNNIGFKIYYSDNGNANKDLTDGTNKWSENVENLSEVKSFLIVPEDENYVMDNGTVLRFGYEYLIPGDLEHNAYIYSTFATYYTQNTEEGEKDEVSAADIVYLTTGVGPQFNIETSSDTTAAVTEFEQFAIESTVTNDGKDTAYNVRIGIPVPEGTKFINAKSEENLNYTIEGNTIYFEIPEMGVGQTAKVNSIVEVQEYDDSEENSIEIYSNVSAQDLSKTIESTKTTVELKQAEMKAALELKNEETEIWANDDEIHFKLKATNLKNETLSNAVANMKLSDAYTFEKAYVEVLENSKIVKKDVDCFDSATRDVNWNIDNLGEYKTETLNLLVKTNKLEDGLTKLDVSNQFTVKAEGTEEYTSPEKTVTIGGANLEIKQTSGTSDTYIKEGDKIKYSFSITNTGTIKADEVKLVDKIPEGLTVTNVNYIKDGIEVKKKVSSKNEAVVNTAIRPGETLDVNLVAVANRIGQTQELSVTNAATVTAKNAQTVTSNSITHIIEAKEEKVAPGQTSNNVASSDRPNANNSNITKTYKISGIAWLDSNENGMREESEERLSAVSVMLVNSDTGVIKEKITTNSKGAYTFTSVENGRYIIIFDYDTSFYSLTAYQKDGVTTDVNSDVITTTIEQEGKQRIGAVTDVITVESGSVSNIDIGLVLADSFDLKLEKKISKLSVQTEKGMENYDYENVDLAKTEIYAKYLSGSTVYIEYTFKVSNIGELAGYARKIVDYLPEDLTFNSGLDGNENWYTGTDGNLYSTTLANVNINPGESKEIKLVLMKQMTEENTGLISNTAEIAEDYNIYGVTDKNSKPANRIQNENDMSTADVYIGIKTGEAFIYTSVIITSAILGGIVIFLAYNRLIYRKRKEGGV